MRTKTLKPAGQVPTVEKLGVKNVLGTTIMGAAEGFAAGLMTSWFMIYLTDYAGLGKWAAALGSTVLLAVRAFDAVNDPLQGWIMDNAKISKIGKYKPFIILSIIMMLIGVSAMFFIPAPLLSNPVAVGTWIVFFYPVIGR
jgi:Na+/melibiose symporter-like transporter